MVIKVYLHHGQGTAGPFRTEEVPLEIFRGDYYVRFNGRRYRIKASHRSNGFITTKDGDIQCQIVDDES